ncbi:hypothetical protein GTP91_26795 [Rugamonas sp. FT82W]|uniref:Tle cognate immunity protein 4 C-terminal domain-containing protein n=1 Tax=Duganella vulcania TaxID=2692166 RepID=A0A845GCW3_9BURK|nr:T6SS immunity protein Tli4 family protein [Duganella vulcania]MYM90768.1 hypothetical protein [Duganella vulcania]
MTASSLIFEHLFDKTKTVCFGRFLINVPLSAQVVYGPTEAPLSLERHPGKAVYMEEVIAARLAEIERDRYRAYDHLLDHDSMLGKVIRGAVAHQKIVFGVSPGGGDFYRIESYLPAGEDLFVQKVNPYGERAEYEKAVEKLNAIARLFRPRAESDIPMAPGVCIDGGFIRDSEELTHENFRLGLRLEEYPDVHFSIATIKRDFLIESDAIEPRLKQAEDEAKRSGNGGWFSRIKFLRRGQSKIGNWSGFEVLARKPASAAEEESHEFAFLSQGEPKNSYLPSLDIKLHTGVRDNKTGRVKPGITDEEAVMLWDRLTNSIRVRPTTAASAK